MSFDDLPDMLLIKIYSNLKLKDKYRLSRTNNRLYNLFSNQYLWEDCHIVFRVYSPHLEIVNSEKECIETAHRMDQFEVIITRYGHHIKKLSFIIIGNFESSAGEKTVDDDQLKISNLALQFCDNLEKLTVETGKWFSRSRVYRPLHKSSKEFLEIICNIIIKNEKRIHTVLIESWPLLLDDESLTVLKYLPGELERLSLFYPDIDENTWVQQNAFVPHPDNVISCLSKLRNLTTLSLHCSSISSQLLNELSATRTRSNISLYPLLSHLKILLTYENHMNNFYKIHSEFWKKLHRTHENLSLSISIGNKIPIIQLTDFLAAIHPIKLHSISISKFSRYEATLLASLTTYSKHLKSFIDYSKGCSDLSDLMSFVEHCPLLDTLIYNGDIEVKSVIHLITAKHWRRFQINLDNIIIQYPIQPYDPDHVIVKDERTGQYVQASLFLQPEKGFHVTNDNESFRRETLDNLENIARMNLRCIWKPLRRGKDCMW